MPSCPQPVSSFNRDILHCPVCHAEFGSDDLSLSTHDDHSAQHPGRRKSQPKNRSRETAVEPVSTSKQSAGLEVEPIIMRPVNRPPMAVLTALDDGSDESGEIWRIRASRFLIGRADGDCLIPHDKDISALHCEIGYRWKKGSYRWYLLDRDSTNGTFLKVKRAVLRNGKQLILGGRRYEFRHERLNLLGTNQNSADLQSKVKSTHHYESPPPNMLDRLVPRLVEQTTQNTGIEYELVEQDNRIGSDSSRCTLVVEGDPFINPEHARIFQNKQGQWMVEDVGSLNGIWLRIHRVSLDIESEFLIGQQRFKIRFP